MVDWLANSTDFLVPSLIVVVGWFVVRLLDRREKRRVALEKRKDMQKAIYAEILSYQQLLKRYDLDEFGKPIQKKMRDKNFLPFVANESNDQVFQALLPEIHALPLETIDAVTLYYHTVRSVSLLIEDMRGERFKVLEPDRRALIYGDYIEIKKLALKQAEDALSAIENYDKSNRN